MSGATAASPTRILFLAAEPTDQARLRLGRELDTIHDCLSRSRAQGRFKIIPRMSTTAADLQHLIRVESPAVVHFSGHGAGHGGLWLENADGRGRLVSTEALAELFQLFGTQKHQRVRTWAEWLFGTRTHLDCVVLNSCLASFQAEVIGRHIPYVVGMAQEIGDDAAIDFSRGFYSALFDGEPYARAFEFGRNAIHLESLPGAVQTVAEGTRKLSESGEPEALALPEHLIPVLMGMAVGVPNGDEVEGPHGPGNDGGKGGAGGHLPRSALTPARVAVATAATGVAALALAARPWSCDPRPEPPPPVVGPDGPAHKVEAPRPTATAVVAASPPRDADPPPDRLAVASALKRHFLASLGLPKDPRTNSRRGNSGLRQAIFLALPDARWDRRVLDAALRDLEPGFFKQSGFRDGVDFEEARYKIPDIARERKAWLEGVRDRRGGGPWPRSDEPIKEYVDKPAGVPAPTVSLDSKDVEKELEWAAGFDFTKETRSRP